ERHLSGRSDWGPPAPEFDQTPVQAGSAVLQPRHLPQRPRVAPYPSTAAPALRSLGPTAHHQHFLAHLWMADFSTAQFSMTGGSMTHVLMTRLSTARFSTTHVSMAHFPMARSSMARCSMVHFSMARCHRTLGPSQP